MVSGKPIPQPCGRRLVFPDGNTEADPPPPGHLKVVHQPDQTLTLPLGWGGEGQDFRKPPSIYPCPPPSPTGPEPDGARGLLPERAAGHPRQPQRHLRPEVPRGAGPAPHQRGPPHGDGPLPELRLRLGCAPRKTIAGGLLAGLTTALFRLAGVHALMAHREFLRNMGVG